MYNKKIIEKDFTIIIPSKEIDNNLTFCIKKIREFYKKVKIILVIDKLTKKIIYKNLDIIKSSNLNIGAKRNLAAKKSKTKFLCFIDSDAFPSEPWLKYHYQNLIRFHISGGPNISFNGNDENKKLVARARFLSFVTYDPDIKSKKFNNKFVEFLPACNFCIRKKTYLSLGGMAENLYTNEEIKLMDNLKKNKFKIFLDSRPFVYHKERGIRKFFYQRLNYGSSLVYNFLKYPSSTSFLGILSLTPVLFFLTIFFVLVNQYIMYFFIIQFSTLLLLTTLFAIKIKKNASFTKSFIVILMCIYGFGLGFIFSLFDHKKLKKFYLQS